MKEYKIRRREDIRPEIEQWKLELATHLDECPVCDEEAGDFCPRARIMQRIVISLGIETLAAMSEQEHAKRKARKQRRLEKKQKAGQTHKAHADNTEV